MKHGIQWHTFGQVHIIIVSHVHPSIEISDEPSAPSCRKYNNGGINCNSNLLTAPQILHSPGFGTLATGHKGLLPKEYLTKEK